ncbi:hypothetical protein [Lysobacter gummosus]|uniref:hypothetical protein n=1 Tax=Lysobacter gummosus TaxID=262324 RepID=UPI0036389F4D
MGHGESLRPGRGRVRVPSPCSLRCCTAGRRVARGYRGWPGPSPAPGGISRRVCAR